MLKKLLAGLTLLVCISAYSQVGTAATDTVDSIYGLEALFVEQQYQFLPIGPPAEDVLVQPYGSVLTVDWKGFPEAFAKRMYATMDSNGFPLYKVSVYEDPATRETVFLNSYGAEVYRLPPEKGYDPYAWQKATFNLGQGQVLDEFHRWIYDPAHVAAKFTLIPEVFHADYLAAQQEESMRALAMVPMAVMAALEGEAQAVVQMVLDTNGLVEISLSLPESFGKHVEIFSKDNLVYSPAWEVAAGWIPTYGYSMVSWSDPSSGNLDYRYYIVSDADMDSDGDGYSDLREHYITGTDPDVFNFCDVDNDGLHDWWETKLFGNLDWNGTDDFDHDGLQNNEELFWVVGEAPRMYTDPSLFDTDGDGLGDGAELHGSPPTDPLNGDATPPVVSIILPTNSIITIL